MAKTTVYIALALGAQEPAYPAYVAFRSPFRFVSGVTVVLPEPSPVALAEDGTGTVAVDPGVWLVDEILPTQVFRRAVVVPESAGIVQYSSLVEVTNPVELGYGPSWAALAQQAAYAAALARDDVIALIAELGRGEPGGVATLDEFGTVPEDQMPARLSPASIYTIVGQQIDSRDIPGQVAAAVAADPTVAAAAAAAVEEVLDEVGIVYGSLLKSPYASTPAEGGFVGENGRTTDLVVDSAGALLDDVLINRWVPRILGPLAAAGFLSGSIISPWYGGGFAGENGRATDLAVDTHGNIEQASLERWAPRLASLLNIDFSQLYSGPDIACIGDSLTASGGIVTRLTALTGRTVRNLGVGGETVTTILARIGIWPFLVTPVGGSIPASGSVDVTFASSYHTPGASIWPLLQGTGVREGDNLLWGTIAGVRVRLSIRVKDPAQDYPLHGNGDVYQITRADAGAAVPLTRPARFLPEYGVARSGDIIIAWLGQNGPSDDATFAGFQAIEQWATKAGKRFLFMTAPGPVNVGWTDLEKRMMDRWGRRFCNVRRFLIDDALAVMGLTPTTTDLDDIAAGRVPTQLRTDSVHHTNAAQQAIAEYLLYPRLQELRMI